MNITPPSGLLGLEQHCDDNSETSDHSWHTTTGKGSRFGKHTNQYHPQHMYCYLPSEQPIPGTLEFLYHSRFTMMHSSPPTTSASQRFPSYEQQCQEHNLHQGGDGRSQMYPSSQFPGQGPSSPGAPGVPSGLPGNYPVNRPTSGSSTPPPCPPCSAPGRPPISLPMIGFQLPAKLCKTDVAGIADLTPEPHQQNVDQSRCHMQTWQTLW